MNRLALFLLYAIIAILVTACPGGDDVDNGNGGDTYYVSSTAIDDSGDGLSPATAKLTITAAIAVASAPAEVWVNAGTYNVNSDTTGTPTHVVLTEGISLYGGYTADFSVRDPAVYITTITDNSTLAIGDGTLINRALEAGAGISDATIVDGFVLNGSTQTGADITVAIWIHDGGAPIVQNNTLNGGSSGTGGTFSYGMINDTSSPTVRNNTFNGGSGVYSYGMLNTNASSPTVQNNTLNGGSGYSSRGMFNASSSSPIVLNNTLNGGSGSNSSYGMFNFSASPTVLNNTLNGGSGDGSYGMANFDSSPTIDNNIIFTSGAGMTYCIAESDAGSDPASVRNNDLFSCTTVYRDFDAGCIGNGDNDGDDTTCTLAEMEALTDFGSLGVSGNVSVDPEFLDIDDDWHFSGLSPGSVTAGGLNGEDDGGWGFTTDKDGFTRPGTGSNWSMGAYEP